MILSELKLTKLDHCYVHLPLSILEKAPNLKPGSSVISVRSVQHDTELQVLWNGQFTNSEAAQLDLTFAQANSFQDGLVVITSVENSTPIECSLCRVELLDDNDYSILSQHSAANVLDTCKLIYNDLVIPIWLSQGVKVLVRVLHSEPSAPLVTLTKWTEMQFQHTCKDSPKLHEPHDSDNLDIEQPIQIISHSLGIDYEPKFYLGSLLVHGDSGSGKSHFLKRILKSYRKFYCQLYNCREFRGKRPESVKKKLDELFAAAVKQQPAIIALDDIDSFLSRRPNSNGEEEDKGQEAVYRMRLADSFCHFIKQIERQGQARVFLVATCRSFESLDERICNPEGRCYFNKLIRLQCPDPFERVEILKAIIDEHKQVQSSITDQELSHMTNRCESFLPADLRKLAERAVINACSRSSLDFSSDLVQLTAQDIADSLVGFVPASLRNASLQPKSNLTFDDVGGMESIKLALKKIVLLPLKYPKLFARCPIRPQTSVLLYGPPGCGKTILAEALTSHDGLNSICVRGPELLSKYIGASEAAVRDLFRRAELAKPCIIFFDEFESLAARRGSDSTGVTDRIVNQFLAIMDGVEALSKEIYLVAATSRPDMIDPAILRPGRLDKHIYCPPPSKDDCLSILKVLSRNMNLQCDIGKLTKWSKKLDGFTGADIKSLLYAAQMKSLHKELGVSHQSSDTPKRRNLKLEVTLEHLQESFDDMKEEVKSRYATMLERYPERFARANELIAVRTTLA